MHFGAIRARREIKSKVYFIFFMDNFLIGMVFLLLYEVVDVN
jgi:hypothetical protein